MSGETAKDDVRRETLPLDKHLPTRDAMRTIICEDCGAQRHNAQFKNTRYCASCRLLRDVTYVAATQRPCSHCKGTFAPVDRKDTLCGTCNYGSVYSGPCALCNKDAELYRKGIPVCVRCIRDPSLRRTVVAGLRKGQLARRQTNNHPEAA